MKRVIQIITTAIIIISVLNIINVNTVQAANNEEIMIPVYMSIHLKMKQRLALIV